MGVKCVAVTPAIGTGYIISCVRRDSLLKKKKMLQTQYNLQ